MPEQQGSHAAEPTSPEAEEARAPVEANDEPQGFRFVYELLRGFSVAPLLKVVGNGMLLVTIFLLVATILLGGVPGTGRYGDAQVFWRWLTGYLRYFGVAIGLSCVGEVLLYLRKIADRQPGK